MILIRHGQTEFNRVCSETRRDPGIPDLQLTAVGRSQAATVAQALGAMNPSRLIASPYTRALETAEIIAAELGLPISVEPLIAERFAFTCRIPGGLRGRKAWRLCPGAPKSSAAASLGRLGQGSLSSHIGVSSRPLPGSRYRTERRCGSTPPGPTVERNRYFCRVRGEPR
jgi:Histidine phosphatase superfamily (branch 1)